MELSVIIVSWNTAALTLGCLEALLRVLPPELEAEVLVVDNASEDGSADRVAREFPPVRLIRRPENGGFARANNEAFAVARGAFLFLLNSDTVVQPGCVEGLLSALSADPHLGMVAPRLLNGDRTLQPSCWRFPHWRTAALEAFYLYQALPRAVAGERLLAGYWRHDRARRVDWVMGAAMLVRREVLEAVGGFDERYFMFGEDMEWCWRIRRAGWEIGYEPGAEVIHLGGQSSRRRYGGAETLVKHEAYYRFCRQNLGIAHTTALRATNAAGALLRLGVSAARCALRPSPERRAALRFYHRALQAHVGAAPR